MFSRKRLASAPTCDKVCRSFELSVMKGAWLCMLLVCAVDSQDLDVGVVLGHNNHVDGLEEELKDTDLVLAFAVFRHGDRTPDDEELALYPTKNINKNIFFPFGTKSLTNAGKRRAFLVGRYLRRRYDGFISPLYLPEEITVRSTDYARTKMSGLAAMAGLYPPLPSQKWNPLLDWQPVPYDTLPYDEDDLLYWYNCPRYLSIRNKIYELPGIKGKISRYQHLFRVLSQMTGTNVTTTEEVFYLDNLFQTLDNVGVKPPQWAQKLMPEIQEVTKLEYAIEFYNDEMIRLATGVLMADIINATTLAMAGWLDQPKLRVYSAHENNVAALMAAARVFVPHQPKYGATFSLELRRDRKTGVYGMSAVYLDDLVTGTEEVLPISGCGGRLFCDYGTFLNLTPYTVMMREDFEKQCPLIV